MQVYDWCAFLLSSSSLLSPLLLPFLSLSLFFSRLFHSLVLSLINLKMTRATPQLLSSYFASPLLPSPRLATGPWKGLTGCRVLRIVGDYCHFEPLSHTPLTLLPLLFRQAFLLSLAGGVENGKALLLCYLCSRLTAGFNLNILVIIV